MDSEEKVMTSLFQSLPSILLSEAELSGNAIKQEQACSTVCKGAASSPQGPQFNFQ